MTTLEFLKDMREDTPVEWMELDKAIAELEALESRICENCRHFLFYSNSKQSGTCDNEDSIAYTSKEVIYCDDGCNKWEA